MSDLDIPSVLRLQYAYDSWPAKAADEIDRLRAELDRIGRIEGVRDRAGVGDGSVHDAVVTLHGALIVAEARAAELEADSDRFRWLAEHTVATGLAGWVHPHQSLSEVVDARMRSDPPHITTAAELRQQAKSDTSCVGAFARARPGKKP